MGPEIRNLTPFANMHFANWDAEGREFGVFMVKTAWDILPDGTCKLSDEQEPFVFSDEFHGALNETAVRYPSDLVPYKPKTDILLNATGFAPGGRVAEAWDVRLRMRADTDEQLLIDKTLSVTGPRRWEKGLSGWSLTEPEPVRSCDLRFDYAYGGVVYAGDDDDGEPIYEALETNPVGAGYVNQRRLREDDTPINAPQILARSETLLRPEVGLTPVGYGPIAAAWLPRRPRGGTYDAAWQENVWPKWPTDYDFAFHNSAPDDQQVDLPQGAGVVVELTNMHPSQPVWTIHVPDPGLVVYGIDGEAIVLHRLTIDTITLDIAEDRLRDARAFQTHRMVFDISNVDQLVLAHFAEHESQNPVIDPRHPRDVANLVEEFSEEVS